MPTDGPADEPAVGRMDRAAADALDRADPLRPFRDQFSVPEDGPVYLDGNSLGRPPRAVVAAASSSIEQWGSRLVSGWDRWIDLPVTVGDRLGRLVGAGPGQTLVCDSTTVNLYKLAAAAVTARPGRRAIVAQAGDFPTDRYVLQGLARAAGAELRLVPASSEDADQAAADIVGAVDSDTALVCLSHVHYRSGLRLDGAEVTRAVQERGALILWDLAHSAGAVPVSLDDWGADLAVGCTYKYLNAGPGAPGFLYVRAGLQGGLTQPIWGWFGQADQFAMGEGYEPAPGLRRFLTGTPGVIGLQMVAAAVEVLERAGPRRLWAKSQQLTALLTGLVDEHLVPLGARLAGPRRPEHRGAHVAVAHPQAWSWCRTLIEAGLVVGDFRAPDVLRLGPAPIYTRFVDCVDAVAAMAAVLASGPLPERPAGRVT